MKRNIKRLLILGLALMLPLLFTACQSGAFNGRGTAEINIGLDESYPGLTVQCPGGTVTGSGTAYKIALKTRALTDVILACEGYETLTLTFTTADLSSGSCAKNGISLSKKKVLLTLSVTGSLSSDDVAALKFKILGDNAVVDKTVDKKNVALELSVCPKTADDEFTVEVSGDGFHTNNVKIEHTAFVNYKAGYKVPILSKASGLAVVTIVNDLYSYVSYSVRTFPYGYYAGNGYINDLHGSSVIQLKNTCDYALSDGGYNSKSVYLKSGDLKTNPYVTVKASEFYGETGGGDQTEYDVRLGFKNTDDEFVTDFNFAVEPMGGYYKFNVYDGQELYFYTWIAGYKWLHQLVFTKDLFNPDGEGGYKYDVLIYRQKEITVNFNMTDFQSMGCQITHPDGFQMDEASFSTAPYKITVSEDMIGAVFTFNGSSYDSKSYTAYDGNYRLTADDYAAGSITVTLKQTKW